MTRCICLLFWVFFLFPYLLCLSFSLFGHNINQGIYNWWAKSSHLPAFVNRFYWSTVIPNILPYCLNLLSHYKDRVQYLWHTLYDMTHKNWNSYYQALYGKNLPTPELGDNCIFQGFLLLNMQWRDRSLREGCLPAFPERKICFYIL